MNTSFFRILLPLFSEMRVLKRRSLFSYTANSPGNNISEWISAASKIAWHITKQSEQLTQLASTNPIAGFKAFHEKLPLLEQKRAKVRAGSKFTWLEL